MRTFLDGRIRGCSGEERPRPNPRARTRGYGVHEGSYVGIATALTDPVRRREVRHALDDYLRRFEGDEREER